MILAWLIVVPLVAGALAWLGERQSVRLCRWIALLALGADLALLAAIWLNAPAIDPTVRSGWLVEAARPWIPRFGIDFHVAMDGLGLLMVALTLFLGIVAVACSWTEIRERVGFFHANLLWSIAGIVGVFVALDLFLFFFLWEVMLVPMYFLIAIWGHENRIYSAIKFFIFTQASSLLMLASIVGLAWINASATGEWTFNYFALLGTDLEPNIAMWLMLGFFIAFAVKLPAVPFHTWLPDAHTDAPTAGSIILAGVLLKTGAYGLIRFVVPLFPDAAMRIAPVAMALAVAGILYGAVLAFAQVDFKRLVAYTSVSHLGFVLLGIFAWNELALQGAIMGMIAHGLSTGGLFAVAGALQERLHTRDMRRMGGLWLRLPRMGAVALFFAIASLGLPGLANFVAEFLVLLGSFAVAPAAAVLAAVGLIFAAVYSLVLIQRSFHGPAKKEIRATDFDRREMAWSAAMIVALVWLGLRPQPVFDAARPTLEELGVPAVLSDEGAEP
ncbi:MAG: NADH-quinone oxidoreductase subunit M [Gammaproteobacteria bacterium]|nr:NADH-quinone oxidoreductase subunit M [Gammaproteobacteria bacterium]